MNTIGKIKQKWDTSLSKSYASAFKAALVNFDTHTDNSKLIKTNRPVFAGL